ncbi:hypothetical protein F383_33973 [Gossypium arboreum]|uniref:Uncharacterized protein n=1 Tax=Gossypium arboreum TaxID=29729 RepID=A0A0B0PW27_GOSAR|nr:hypothetical protein F383_33973 [Gossypium arboreum]
MDKYYSNHIVHIHLTYSQSIYTYSIFSHTYNTYIITWTYTYLLFSNIVYNSNVPELDTHIIQSFISRNTH